MPVSIADETKVRWDFDHKLQFLLTEISDNQFNIQVFRQDDTRFNRMSAFLMRKAFEVCKGYQYKLEVIKGVERFDDKRSFPNMIFDTLVANIECKVTSK